jgi:DNA-directed RNA polymerase subunit RPC12/RpoP
MSATLSYTCPECQTQLRGPAELQGKKGRCKHCGHVFVLKAPPAPKAAAPKAKPAPAKGKPAPPPAKAPAPPPKAAEDNDSAGEGVYGFMSEEAAVQSYTEQPEAARSGGAQSYNAADRNPYGVTDLDLTPRCPFCAKEMLSEEAIICVHCGYNTQTRSMGATKRTYANTGRDIFLWLLPGILCVIAALALIGGIVYLWQGLPDPEDPKLKEEWWISFIRPAQVWGSFLAGAMIWAAGLFAVYRLILHPTPPEVEKK